MYKTYSFYASVYASVDESAFDAADGMRLILIQFLRLLQ
jgi:hypothetical protein